MQHGINKVIIVGRIGNQPEMKHLTNGNQVVNLSVATSERWKDKTTGDNRENTEWHKVVMFGRLAEIASTYLATGSKVYLEGKLQTRKWQDQMGVTKYMTEIVANNLQMLDSKQENTTNVNRQPVNAIQHKAVQPVQPAPMEPSNNVINQSISQSNNDNWDDIPF